MTVTATPAPVTVAELVAALTDQRRETSSPPLRERYRGTGSLGPAEGDVVATVVVLGAHPGAGASSVAIALAGALAEREAGDLSGRVRLVDAATPETSGLICAADRELGTDPTGWRVGSRQGIEVHRPPRALSNPADVPAMASLESGWLVVDAGWSIRDLVAGVNTISPLLSTARVVLVCRATVPGVRRAELALAHLATPPLVVAVGARRWPGEVQASFGPSLRQAREAGRVVLVPADRRLELTGIDAQSLPRTLTAAAAQLLDLLWPGTPSEATHRSEGTL